MSQYLLAFLAALFGVIGTGVGVFAAFVPTELIAKRDYYERLMKFWSLLQFEREQIIIQSGKFHDLSVDSFAKIDATLSPISLAAWHAALSNSEFIGGADPDVITNLAASYVLLERLNAAVDNYKLVCVAIDLAYSEGRVRGMHKEMQSEGDVVKAHFESLQTDEDRERQECERKLRSKQGQITGLSIFAIIIFSAAILACIVLGILLYING